MPKTLILFHSRFGGTAALANALAEGARSVRFSEVTVRRLDDLIPIATPDLTPEMQGHRDAMTAQFQLLGHVDELTGFDGIILGSPARGGIMSAEVRHLLERAAALRATGAFTNTIGSAFAGSLDSAAGRDTTAWSIMTSLADLGMVLVPPTPGADALSGAVQQGRRVAELVSWVTHARSHSHAASPAHTHSH